MRRGLVTPCVKHVLVFTIAYSASYTYEVHISVIHRDIGLVSPIILCSEAIQTD